MDEIGRAREGAELAQAQLNSITEHIDWAINSRDKALEGASRAVAILGTAATSLSEYRDRNSEALEMGTRMEAEIITARRLLTSTTAINSISQVADHTKAAQEQYQGLITKQNEAVDYGDSVLNDLGFAAARINHFTENCKESALATGLVLGSLRAAQEILSTNTVSNLPANETARNMVQKVDQAAEEAGQLWMDLHVAKDFILAVAPELDDLGPDESMDERPYDLSSLAYIRSCLGKSQYRLEQCSQPDILIPELVSHLELITSEIKDTDTNTLNDLLERMKKATSQLEDTKQETESLPILIQQALEDMDTFLKQL